MTELQQATTAQLLDELHARYPNVVFAGLQDAPGDAERDDAHFYFQGAPTTALGLTLRLRAFVVRYFAAIPFEAEPEDDRHE